MHGVLDVQLSKLGADRADSAGITNRTLRATGLSLAFALATAPPTAAQTWNVDAGGTWGTGSNWSTGTAPNAVDASATLGPVITAPQTITLGTATTVGALTFAGSQSYTVNGSSLTFDVGAGTAALASTATATQTIASAVVLNDTLNLNLTGTGGVGISGIISGTGGLTLSGTDTLTLTGSLNTYQGATTINSGTLQFSGNGRPGSGAIVNNGTLIIDDTSFTSLNTLSGTGALVQQGSGRTDLLNASGFSGKITISAGVLFIGQGGAIGSIGSGDIENNASLATYRSGTVTLANAISGIGDFSAEGRGTTILTGNNSYSGATTINSGTLQVGDGGTIGTLGVGDVFINSGTLAINRAGTIALANAISGAGDFVQKGSGTTILTGANDISGTITISAGTLQVGNGGTTGTLGTGAVTNNGILAFNRSDTIAIDNAISGTGSLVQQGSGTTILTGTKTYSGPTSVLAGRLAVNGSITSAVTVSAAGTLGGNGTITGNVTNNGTLAPGNSIGTLNVVGTYTQAAGSTYQVELNAAGQVDLINVTGKAVLNGGTVNVQATPGNYAWNDNRMSRSLVIPGLSPRLAQGRTGADLWQGQLELGYRLPFDLPANAALTPFARFQAASLGQAAFTETGANGLDLAVAAGTATSLRSVLGLAAGTTLPLGEEQPLSVQLRLGWMHEYASLARPVAASFAGAPGSNFMVYGAEGQRDAITLNFLASMPLSSRAAAFARYDGELAATGANHGFLAGLKMSW